MLSSILIVDDDKNIRATLSSAFNDQGYSVETVENGKEAIKICKKLPFDVAVIDIMLPDIKGTELLGALKLIQPKMVRIIATGHPSVENAIKSVNEKADGYILKPFNPMELLELMKRLYDQKTTDQLRIFAEFERARENAPKFKYQNPDKW
jgi:DNA-binding NtrC family response regulator